MKSALVVALSGGALGISFAFVERFVGDDPPLALWALMAAWVAWVCSLALVLGSHFFSTQALRKAVTQVDEKKINTERVGGNYDRVLVWLNAIGGITFILGTSFAGNWKTARMVAHYSAGATAERGAVARYL